MDIQNANPNATLWEDLSAGFREMALVPESSVFYSWANFLDFLVFLITILVGVYTGWLFGQTIYFIKCQSSLVENLKQERYKSSRALMKSLSEFERSALFKKRPELTWQQTFEAIFNQSCVDFYTFLPFYQQKRSVQEAQRKFQGKLD